MIDHASAPVRDLVRSKELYKAMLAPLGYELQQDLAEYNAAGFGVPSMKRQDFWLGGVESEVTGVHIAFHADTQEQVDAFHAAGLAAGGTDNGAPGYREMYSPNYYGAFIHDFDSNNIEVVWRDPSKASTN